MRHLPYYLRFWAPACFVMWLCVPSCDTSTFVLGTLEGPEAMAGAGGAVACRSLAASCSVSADCCEGECIFGSCEQSLTGCHGSGASCSEARDCCSFNCQEGACAGSCVADGADCTRNVECCSGMCEEGSCLALNSVCLTSGNPCEDSADCCSQLCSDGFCLRQSSFCAQEGDICFMGGECCSHTCLMDPGASAGTCAAAPRGPSNCSAGIAGSLCSTCNDCCSRLCVPFGGEGLSVCAQAKGCKQTGELCSDDRDCCGGDASVPLPGAGNVVCTKNAGEDWGVCRNALSCSPQGNVCHIQNYACGVSAASNRCCGQDESEGVCRLDGDGIPRCTGLGSACQVLGDACAMSEDCCEGACLPGGSGSLTCQSEEYCLPLEAGCTATSECCPGSRCVQVPLVPFGTCSTEGATACAVAGQVCSSDGAACCAGLSCNLGRCTQGEP